ncbi:MAG TPA: hypothetical protein VJV03_09580 [Pyrinomonadaceae bacterium]|nr:hypothetical protein [Pyrinomonadaceae bacterium]
MKTPSYLIIGLLIISMAQEAQAAPRKSPRVVASEFYASVVREDISGLPDEQEMRALRPYLSLSLRSLLRRALKTEAEAIRRTPAGDKPPILEGCLFSCLYEGPEKFRVSRQRVSGQYAYVKVEQRAGPDEWTDTLILVMERGRWLVWDVRLGCSRPHMGEPTLRGMIAIPKPAARLNKGMQRTRN